MRRIAPILGVLVLIVVLVFVNRGINQATQPSSDTASTPSPKQTSPAKPTPAASASVELPAEVTIGDPAKAKSKITVGWVYDDVNQPNPQALSDALQAIEKTAQKSGGATSAEIVDLDVPLGDLSPLAGSVTGLGVSVNGKPVGPAASPGEDGLTADILSRILPEQAEREALPPQ